MLLASAYDQSRYFKAAETQAAKKLTHQGRNRGGSKDKRRN